MTNYYDRLYFDQDKSLKQHEVMLERAFDRDSNTFPDLSPIRTVFEGFRGNFAGFK